MRIKSLAQGENILMLGIEPSTFVSKVDILTTTPIAHIRDTFSQENLLTVLSTNNANIAYENVIEIFCEHYYNCWQANKVTIKKNMKPWMTNGLKRACMNKLF